jgi:branched-chain amino acid transport system substrate-binding protein
LRELSGLVVLVPVKAFCQHEALSCFKPEPKKLKELPVDDVFAQGGKVLENGRMVHDLYLFEVKKPSESKKPWDYYKQLAVVSGDKAFPPAKDSGCPLTK